MEEEAVSTANYRADWLSIIGKISEIFRATKEDGRTVQGMAWVREEPDVPDNHRPVQDIKPQIRNSDMPPLGYPRRVANMLSVQNNTTRS